WSRRSSPAWPRASRWGGAARWPGRCTGCWWASGGGGWRPARRAPAWARTWRRCWPSCACRGRPTRGRASRAWTRCARGRAGAAAECGLRDLAGELLASLEGPFLHAASLPELIEALELGDRLLRDHVPGHRLEPERRDWLRAVLAPALTGAARRQVEGLAGSD